MTPLDKLKEMKRHTTYAKLSQRTGLPEQQLIRWITGKNRMSHAWSVIITARLK